MVAVKPKNTAWQRFKKDRLGYWSLWTFLILFGIIQKIFVYWIV